MKHPLEQLPAEHTSPLPQELPGLSVVHEVVDELGWQLWHAFAELVAPLLYTVPLMKQALVHAFAEQISPAPQALPVLRKRHAVVDKLGWQVWHAFAGLLTPLL